MKLNWAERWVVNNPSRVFQQQVEVWLLKRMMPLSYGTTILEVGCGRGAGAKLIRKVFQPARLMILDLDFQMIQKAKTYLNPEAMEQMSLYVGDAAYLPFKTNSLDALFGERRRLHGESENATQTNEESRDHLESDQVADDEHQGQLPYFDDKSHDETPKRMRGSIIAQMISDKMLPKSRIATPITRVAKIIG